MPASRTLALCVGLLLLAGCGGNTGRVPIGRAARPIPCPSQRFRGRPAKAFDARELVGLSETQAAAAAARQGCTIRVYRLDGHDQILTADLRLARINVEIVHGIVEKVWSVG